MRGENTITPGAQVNVQGTSPRARGKLGAELPDGGFLGNIPACAGKTHVRYFLEHMAEEHPRVRGENFVTRKICSAKPGTSPRARGKPVFGDGVRKNAGNIPACAGKTPTPPPTGVGREEHPRVRGENLCSRTGACNGHGTSPRARGKHYTILMQTKEHGNIPACAGKTVLGVFGCVPPLEHPRVRGENTIYREATMLPEGTSPRARGKLLEAIAPATSARNIPACAGKTKFVHALRSRFTEHPRVRGENRIQRKCQSSVPGTSPRARGKPQV